MRVALVCILLCFELSAATYYFSTRTGDDSRTPQQAQSSLTPWATLAKANSLGLGPGDSVLFCRGESFRGALEVVASGSAGAPVVYGSYGSGPNAVIQCSAPLASAWVSDGTGRYKTTTSFAVQQLFYDSRPMSCGRYPDSGFARVDTVNSVLDQFFDYDLPGSIDWSGAAVHIRTMAWSLDARRVKNYAAQTITLDRTTNYPIPVGAEYFLNNHQDAVDQPGEWFWDSTQGTLLFATPDGLPPRGDTIEATVEDIGISIQSKQHVVIESLTVFAPFSYGIRTAGASNTITIRHCSITYPYGVGISVSGGSGMRVEDNSVVGANYYGIQFHGSGGVVRGNEVRGIGLVERLGKSGLGGGCCQGGGMQIGGRSNSVSLNRIDSTGHSAIGFSGPYQHIERNVISNFCLTTSDGAGVYTWSGSLSDTGAAFSVIRENIITGASAPAGAGGGSAAGAHGIYLDDRTHDIVVEHNTISSTSHALFFHNAQRHRATNNLIYKCAHHAVALREDLAAAPGQMQGMVMENNTLFMLSDQYYPLHINSRYASVDFFSALDNNYYVNMFTPFAVKLDYAPAYPQSSVLTSRSMTLGDWQKSTGWDAHSGHNRRWWQRVRVSDTLGENMVDNGTFDTGIEGWRCWSDTALCSAQWQPAGSGQGGQLVATLPSHPRAPYGLINGNRFPITAAQSYLLSFRAQAQAPAAIRAIIRMAHEPYATVGLAQAVLVNTVYTSFSLPFTASSSDPSCRIDFEFQRGDSLWWLDDVALHPVSLDTIDNEKNVRLISNQSVLTNSFALDRGNWRDVYGTLYSSSITLQPFRSALLIADTSWVASTHPLNPAPRLNPLQLSWTVLPNGSVRFFVKAVTPTVNLTITTLNGRTVFSDELRIAAGGTSAVGVCDAGGLAAGVYIAQVKSAAAVSRVAILLP